MHLLRKRIRVLLRNLAILATCFSVRMRAVTSALELFKHGARRGRNRPWLLHVIALQIAQTVRTTVQLDLFEF